MNQISESQSTRKLLENLQYLYLRALIMTVKKYLTVEVGGRELPNCGGNRGKGVAQLGCHLKTKNKRIFRQIFKRTRKKLVNKAAFIGLPDAAVERFCSSFDCCDRLKRTKNFNRN